MRGRDEWREKDANLLANLVRVLKRHSVREDSRTRKS